MKTTLFAGILFLAITLTGCIVVPSYVPGAYYGQPAQYYAPQYHVPPIYSQYYTPRINYHKPRGVWYPWGRMNGDDSRERNYRR